MGNLERDRCPICNNKITPVAGRIVYCDEICHDIALELRKDKDVALTSEPAALNEAWRSDLRAGVERWQRESSAALNAYKEAQLHLDALLFAATRQGADAKELSEVTELRLVQIRDRVARFTRGLTHKSLPTLPV